MDRLGFIGTGHMTRTMVRHLAPRGHEIRVTQRGRATSDALVAAFDNVQALDADEVVAGSDVVFLCLRPAVAEAALDTLPFRDDQRVVSVMAGISHQTLAQWCAPARSITLMLPMELIERGGCPIVIWPEDAALAALFEPENTVIPLADEAALSACFAATTLVSAVAETLDVGTAWLGDRIGPDDAQRFVGRLLTGMLDIHADQPSRFARLRDSIATSGTLNLDMVETLRDLGLPRTLRAKLDALER